MSDEIVTSADPVKDKLLELESRLERLEKELKQHFNI
jgi:hypothetical protein